MRTVRHVAAIVFTTIAVPLAAQQQQQPQPQARWVEAKCDLKPDHFQVNQGMMYLKSAATARDPDQKTKDLSDAQRMLTQALTVSGQEKNPAAWYYLGRYYLMVTDVQGADSAFRKAQALKPTCEGDIMIWRRSLWVPTFNAGIAAWQANNLDSGLASFRRATFLFPTEPTGFKYAATLFYNLGHADSAAVYFRKAIGDRDKLNFNPDGSLDIYIQNDNPGKDKESNWLPAPKDSFNVTLRIYWPKQDLLERRWTPPGIQRAT